MAHNFSLAIHGGAGTITRGLITAEQEAEYLQGLNEALNAGKNILKASGTATDAVEAAIIHLENNPIFNAGRGSVFNNEGNHEMDAAIMDGSNLDAGAVTCVQHIKNPIAAAKAVMLHSDHVLLSGNGAEYFAKAQNLILEEKEYFYTQFRYNQWQDIANTEVFQLDHSAKKFGTVGAVACDEYGNLAAGTSTGGMTNKRWGRIGDTPLIGAGTYANNATCAVSCTGHGELFIRAVVAYDISCLMEYAGLSLDEACNKVVMQKLVAIQGEGGLIAVDRNGNVCMPFNSEGMYRGFANNSRQEVYIYK